MLSREWVSQIQQRTNESILNEINGRIEILKTIKTRRWNLVGHILKHENELVYN